MIDCTSIICSVHDIPLPFSLFFSFHFHKTKFGIYGQITMPAHEKEEKTLQDHGGEEYRRRIKTILTLLGKNHAQEFHKLSLENPGDQASGNSSATLSEVESLPRVNSHRFVDGALDLKIVSGHDHLVTIVGGSFRKVDGDRDIRGSQEHLRAVVAMESSVASPLLLSKDVK